MSYHHSNRVFAANARGRRDYGADYFEEDDSDGEVEDYTDRNNRDYVDYEDDRKPAASVNIPSRSQNIRISQGKNDIGEARESAKLKPGDLQSAFESSFAALAHDFVFNEQEMNQSERDKFDHAQDDFADGGFAFLEEPDAKGFSRLHKLINGIPYDAESHRGWDAVRKYVDFRGEEGTLKVELEEYQNKTTPMLMACCRKPPLDIIDKFVKTSEAVLTQKHERYLGMIALHFACKFFASKEVISYLVKAMPDTIVMQDKGDRTPVHCMLNNFECKLPTADVLRLLIRSKDEEGTAYSAAAIKNNNKCTPLHYLVFSTKSIDPDDPDEEPERINARDCVDVYFEELDVDALTLATELAPFPPWLVERVVSKPYVQAKLNELMAQSFNAEVIIADVLIHSLIVTCFWMYSFKSLDARRNARFVGNDDDAGVLEIPVFVLYITGAYLLLREGVQLYRLKKINLLVRYVSLWSLLDICNAVLLLASTICIHLGKGNDDRIKILFMCTGFAVWFMYVSLLKGVNYRFAIFLSGMLNILAALMPFFLVMAFTLGAFALVYQLDAHGTVICVLDQSTSKVIDIGDIGLNFCTWKDSFLKVYTMFVSGEVQEDDYTSRTSTMAVSIVFAFIVAIILLKAVVAVMTAAYLHSEENAKAFFYFHRFNLVVELDQVYNLRPKKIKSDREIETRSSKKQVLWDICIVAFADPAKGYVKKRKMKLDQRWTGWKWVKKAFLGDPSTKEPPPIYRKALCFTLLLFWFPLGTILFGKLLPISMRTLLISPRVKVESKTDDRKETNGSDNRNELKVLGGVPS